MSNNGTMLRPQEQLRDAAEESVPTLRVAFYAHATFDILNWKHPSCICS